MTVKTLHIKNPTPKLMEFVKKLQANKEAKQQMLDAKREKYFEEESNSAFSFLQQRRFNS